MAEKPILFNTKMVKAILDGRKRVTRRICKGKGQPQDGATNPEALGYKPPYEVGDILWVRETWNVNNLREEGNDTQAGFIYKASDDTPDCGFRWASIRWGMYGKYEVDMSEYFDKWRPSIHMPYEAARIFLRVIFVRAGRLQEYFDASCAYAEGVKIDRVHSAQEAVDAFKEIWNGTIKSSDIEYYGWDANPWVWVIGFERLDGKPAGLWADRDTAQWADQDVLMPAT